MDRVRLGRVLGRGTRMAAKTLYEAVDAATSAPSAGSAPTHAPVPSGIRSSEEVQRSRPSRRPVVAARPVAPKRNPLSSSPSLFAPVRRASRAVSLELTGSFFALFAFAFAVAGWRTHASLQAGGEEKLRLLLYCAVTLVFAYFAVSNFLRARK